MQITQLLETIRLKHNPEENSIIIFNLNLHTERLLKSLLELDFKIKETNIELSKQNKNLNKLFYSSILDYISEEIKKNFNENLLLRFFHGSFNYNNQEKNIYKLRLLYNIYGEIKTEISIYERFLENNLMKFSISKTFKINSEDKKWQYKFFPREEINLKNLLNNDSETISKNNLDEIIWTNEKNEICEGSFTNIFYLNSDDKEPQNLTAEKKVWKTPYLNSNLLNGTMRKILLNELEASEEKCFIDDLKEAKKIILCNSMIGKVDAELFYTSHKKNEDS